MDFNSFEGLNSVDKEFDLDFFETGHSDDVKSGEIGTRWSGGYTTIACAILSWTETLTCPGPWKPQ